MVGQSVALGISRKLLNDQDPKVRCVYLQNVIEQLPTLYLKNQEHFDSMCTATDDHWQSASPPEQAEKCANPACQKQQRCTCVDELRQSKSKPSKNAHQLDQHQDVKKLVYQLMVKRCTYLAGLAPEVQTAISKEEAANELVRVLCVEIRAMDKDMRIFCADLLT